MEYSYKSLAKAEIRDRYSDRNIITVFNFPLFVRSGNYRLLLFLSSLNLPIKHLKTKGAKILRFQPLKLPLHLKVATD